MYKTKMKREGGFTLLELLVVIALMGIIYSITLSNYNGMNKRIELQNTAYNVALSIRESQIYGINKKLDSGNFSDGDPYPFGLHIDLDSNDEIIIFKDKSPTNNSFDGGCLSDIIECERMIKFNGGNHISALWLDGTRYQVGKKINIMFKRPNPDARITDNEGSLFVYSRAGIELSNKNEFYKTCVEIGSAGDISLKDSCL